VKIVPYLESGTLLSGVMFDRILAQSVVICYRRVEDTFGRAGAERGCFKSVAVLVLPTSAGWARLLQM
jgi:hypothetical protein